MPPSNRAGLLARLGLGRPDARAWAMYDWANSGVYTLVITAVFPIFFLDYASEDPGLGVSRFTLATTLGLTITAVLSPFLGTLADQSASKLKLLGTFVLIGVAASCGMFFIGQGQWQFALVLFMLVTLGINGSFVFYDALLPHVVDRGDTDRLSSAGYALGYLGGGLVLALGLAIIQLPAVFGLPAGEGLSPNAASLPTRIGFLVAAAWWLLFSIPLFRRIPEPPAAPRPPGHETHNPITETFAQLARTFRDLRRYRDAFIFLVAFLIYNDGIGTIIKLATAYGTEIGITRTTMIAAIVVTQFVGVPFAFMFGALAGRIGARPSIFLGIAAYGFIAVLGFYMQTDTHFMMLAVLVGMVQGGTQALSRSLFASMIPKSKSGEFFGFFSVFDKGASILGPLAFWLVLELTGSSRNAILSLILFFAVGAGLLATVNVSRGQAAALEGDA
jgi:UMF1 family MFS transporter